LNNYFKTLKHILEGGYNITFLSGAGISTASGLPDFRGDKDGFWKKNSPVHFSEFKTSKKARLKSWENNIAIQNKIQKAQPTKMHRVINEILKSDGLNFHITQNIDGLHKDENIASEKIIELHGNIFQAECLSCNKSFNTESFYESVVKTKGDSLCPLCKSGFVKVGTISFGQNLNHSVLNQAKFAAENCDYLIAVGSSLKVSPANSFIRIAKKNGAQIVILNYDPTPFDSEASIIINEYIEKICDEIT
tara:strand:+ start:791 stop:1537 length:747 start_codon:yes stop_codon:yes gene_type:complete